MLKTLPLVALSLLLSSSIRAQDAVPVELLQRTVLIKNGNKYGTAFKIDHQNRLYLVTARHLAEGLPADKATIQVWSSDAWKDFPTVKTLLPPSHDVDIAVFETSETLSKPYEVGMDDTVHGVILGQQVWFLGFPFQMGSQWNNGLVAPFIKRGTMSAIDARNPEAIVLYIDGFNNPGFSGGPIVYWDLEKHDYKILAVVQGYKEDTAKVLVNGEHLDTKLLVNSGILVSYSTKHAYQAMEISGSK